MDMIIKMLVGCVIIFNVLMVSQSFIMKAQLKELKKQIEEDVE